MKVLISDAYSPTNVGDGELVRLSIDSVRSRYGVNPTVLCTDKLGFESDRVFAESEFVFKPLSRVRWRTLNTRLKLSMLLKDTAGMILGLVGGSLPGSFETKRSRVRAAARMMGLPWLLHVSEADAVVGVGGGYLGDKYLRESIMTLALFRIAASIGTTVETMPLSVSSANRTALRLALKIFGRNIHWRSREATTQKILVSMGLRTDCVPDLAWLNASRDYPATKTTALVVAPLGSDFYGAQGAKPPKIWSYVRKHIEELSSGESISLIAMHYWDERLQDGRDDQECERVAELIREVNPYVQVNILNVRTYDEVLKHMAGSRLAVCERLHAALAGLAVGTQTKVIGYEPKHRGVLELAGLQNLADETVEFVLDSVSREYIAERGEDQASQTRKSVMGA